MDDPTTAASALSAVVDDAPGTVGAVLGTRDGELRAVFGDAVHGEATIAAVALATAELAAIGARLGLGELTVASLRSPTASRVFARQGGAVLALELDAKRSLGALETRLRTTAWAPGDEALAGATVNRVPTKPIRGHISGSTLPPPSVTTAAPRLVRSPSSAPIRMAGAAVRPQPATGSPSPRMPVSASPAGGPPALPLNGGQVFAGDLDEFALPDLLEFLRNSQRTGILVCSNGTGTGKVQLSHGMIISAESPHALDLREHFLARAELAPEQRRLLAALPTECFGETMIVDELTSRALVPRDEVERARVARIYSAFREMMTWTTGRFSFDPVAPSIGNPALALSAQSILMQIYQEQDEQSR